MSDHLSEESLDDVLIGMFTAEAEQHLAECSACRAKVERFQTDADLFNHASLAWSERRGRTSGAPARHAAVARGAWSVVAWTVAAAMLLAMGIPTWRTLHKPHPLESTVARSQVQDSEAQIAQDNELLKEVSAAISPDDASMVDELLNKRSTIHHKAKAK